jgi:hypothetical protein
MSIATEHAAEAADTLRAAAGIADPYKRADAIWEAVERINAAAERLGGRPAAGCAELARRLEEGCEAGREPPGAEELQRRARALDRIASIPIAASPSREPNRASQLDQPRGKEEP